ncbi:putative pyridine nucleotide-disulfide oxidoreductase family protein [Salmonella phage SSBI34]|nr:putative pyridine nucleotide-disulfide oxidoreductase family protein [Salmonella phage SSBI34]
MIEVQKGRTVKSRGIALTHKDQGYSANQRPVSLLMKSDIDPKNLTVDIIKNLEQVQLKISMQEFLRKFFDMWSSDAEMLTKLLGFQTELEYEAETNPTDEWLQQWNEDRQKYLESKLTSMTIIKKARDGEELTLPEQFELIKTRKAFEDGCIEHGIQLSEEKPSVQKAVEKSSEKPATTVATPPVEVSTPAESSVGAQPTPSEEPPVEKEVDVTKSAAFIEMQKQLEAMKADVAAAQEIIKAKKAADRQVAVTKAAGMTFVADEQREAVADVILNPEMATLVAVLEKAAEVIKAKDEALAAKDAEVEEIKKSFADGKEVGAQGDLTPEAKGEEDAQAALDRIIKARAAALANPTA